MLFFDDEGRLVESRRRLCPEDGDDAEGGGGDAPAAFGWWLADWGPTQLPPRPTSGSVPAAPPVGNALAHLSLNDTAARSNEEIRDEVSLEEDSDVGGMSGNPSGGSSVSVSDQSEAGPTWCRAYEEVDSGLGSRETSLSTTHPSALEPHPSPHPSPLSLPRRLALLRFLRVLRAPECEHTEEQLRVAEQQRTTRARLDGLRADARALLKDAKRLRAQMQACDAHAQSVSGGARRLSEELRETRHLDSVLRWLRGPLPDVALAALPDDASPALAQDSPTLVNATPRAGTPAGATVPEAHDMPNPLRRYRSDGDIPALLHSSHTKTWRRSVPSNYHLLPNDFEETYLNIEPRSPISRSCTNIRHVFLSTDYETPYVDVEPRISPSRRCRSPSDPMRDPQSVSDHRNIDSCEEGLRLITRTEDEDSKLAYMNLKEYSDASVDSEDDDGPRTEDEWSLLSYGSEESLDGHRYTKAASPSQPKAYIDLRPPIFRQQSLHRFLDAQSSPLHVRCPRSRPSMEQAVSARFRGRGFSVAEKLPEEDGDDDSSTRASTPILSRGYSV